MKCRVVLRPTHMNQNIGRKFFSWLIQLTLACVALVAGLEISARYFLPEQIAQFRMSYFGDQRYGFLSKGALANRGGYINFQPDFEFRDVAFYPDHNGKMTLEYDCTFHSDKLGFVSNSRPYEETSILLLGDSFAQGDGGCAWIPRLDPLIRSQIYSTAVMGLGAMHWSHIVADLEKLKTPQKILIVFITDDFFRTDWVYDRRQIDCINEQGDCTGLYWYPVSDNMTDIAAARFRERTRPKGIGRALKYNLIATYSIYKILTADRTQQNAIMQRSLAIASDMAKKYDVRFLWVNERADPDRSSLRAKVLASGLQGLRLTKCDIPASGFMPRDPHPNAEGYDILKTCVEKLVGQW